MKFIKTKFQGAYLIEPQVFHDQRGFFLESYSEKDFKENGIKSVFVQDNHSLSVTAGVLRGFHCQLPPYAQSKLIRVTKGAVYDVIVDIRVGSETFGQWEGFEISACNFLMLYIPRGFAHAFCTLDPNTEFMYKVDNFYAPDYDSGFIWNDQILQVNWPVKNPLISEKDSKLPSFKNFKSPFKIN